MPSPPAGRTMSVCALAAAGMDTAAAAIIAETATWKDRIGLMKPLLDCAVQGCGTDTQGNKKITQTLYPAVARNPKMAIKTR
jgi:hypothetical protein